MKKTSFPKVGTYLLLSVLSLVILFSEAVAGEIFLQGNYIEVGVNDAGSFGTKSSAPAGFHPKVGSWDKRLGFVADHGRDGWTVGTPPQTGDYFVPGTPEEGWMIEWTSDSGTERQFHNFGLMGGVDIPTTSTSDTSSGTTKSAIWEGTAHIARRKSSK